MGSDKVILIGIGIGLLLILTGCNKQVNEQSHSNIPYKIQKYESPLTLNLSYTTNDTGNYYILAILISKESTPISSFELNIPDKFILKGSKKWSGEIKSNIPHLVELEISKEFSGSSIIGIFTASIWGNIFTTNQVLHLDKKNKPSQKIFIEKKNERGEKIADFKIRR